MSMDVRQTQIKERAGLDESRLNQDFIDWLKKWGPYALFALSAVAGLYFLVNFRAKAAAQALDQAYVELDAALVTRSPASLVAVAETHAGQGAVPLLARIAAADVHLEAFRTGVPSGVTVDRDGKLPADKSLLTDEQRQAELKSAEALYQAVADGAGSDQLLLVLSGLNGLAAVAESRGEMDKAKGFYQQVVEKARSAKLGGLADAAQKRIDTLGTLAGVPKLYAKAELPGQPAEAAPVIMGGGMVGTTADGKQIPLGGAGAPTLTGPDGKPIQLQPLPAGFTPPGFKPEGGASPTPAPTPAPAPAPAPTPTPAGAQPNNP